MVWFSLGQLDTGRAGLNDLSGPVGIVTTIKDVGNAAQETAEQNDQNGLLAAAGHRLFRGADRCESGGDEPACPFRRWMADGSFLLVDAVSMALFKRKIPEKYQAAINTAGFVLLMGFMLLVTFQDVFKLVNKAINMTKKLMVGKVAVGGGAPVSIQSMCNTKTDDVASHVPRFTRWSAPDARSSGWRCPDEDAAMAVDKIRADLHSPDCRHPFSTTSWR